MNRSVERTRATVTTPVAVGEILVATHVRHPVRGAVRCPAAPLLAGSLRRRGLIVRYGGIDADFLGSGGCSELRVTSWLDRDGRARGLAAAANTRDTTANAALAEIMSEWTSLLRTRRLLLGGTRPACWGAARAVGAVRQALADRRPVYVHGPMVAEAHALAELRREGATFVHDLNLVPDGATVVLPAQGVSPTAHATADMRSLSIVDSTCPIVTSAHAEMRRFTARGDTVVVIGRADHVVTETLLTHAPESVHFVQNAPDVHHLGIADPNRLSYLVAPGFPVDEATPVIGALRQAYPSIRPQHPDGLCYAATDRSETITGLAEACEVLLVVGEPDCADARGVADQVRADGRATVHVVSQVEDVRPRWLAPAWTVGLTASLSAAPGVLSKITVAVSGLGPSSVVHREITTRPTASHPAGEHPAAEVRTRYGTVS